MQRKNFNYRNATVAEIAEYFKLCTRQNISSVRANWKHDPVMSEKIEKAYREYKIAMLDAKLSQK